jgi:hypothetical protein
MSQSSENWGLGVKNSLSNSEWEVSVTGFCDLTPFALSADESVTERIASRRSEGAEDDIRNLVDWENCGCCDADLQHAEFRGPLR